jgi:hypothetical protein
VRPARWPFLLLAVATSACGLRLSDPIYALRSIQAEEPHFADRSLIFGSIEVDAWLSGDLDSVVFLKRGPGSEVSTWAATRALLFRVFRPRTLKDVHFLVQVPPGIYELDHLVTSGWGRPQYWFRSRGTPPAPRVVVTRPGIYDLGALRIERIPRTFQFLIQRAEHPAPERQQVLERAIQGTSWQRL